MGMNDRYTLKNYSKRNFLLKSLYIYGISFPIKILGGINIISVNELIEIYRQIDNEARSPASRNKVKFICKKGCFECCSDYFYVAKIEYTTILHYLKSTGTDILPIISSCEEKLQQFKTSHHEEYTSLKNNDYSMFTDTSNIKVSNCPFLGSNNECLVYDVRPLICRLYGISHSYGVCNKIKKQSSMLFNRKKVDYYKLIHHTVDIPIEPYLQGIDYDIIDGQRRYLKPYPLFWWFADKKQVLYDLEQL